MPPRNRGGHFVPDGEEQHRRMAPKAAHLCLEIAADTTTEGAVVEKRDMLRPRQPDHESQTVTGCLVEQRLRGGCVQPNGIDPDTRHQCEVFGHPRGRRKLPTVAVGRERAIADTLDDPRFAGETDELADRGGAWARRVERCRGEALERDGRSGGGRSHRYAGHGYRHRINGGAQEHTARVQDRNRWRPGLSV